MRTVVPAALLLLGSGLMVIAAVGLQRFDTVYARTHPATKAITLGIVFLLLGAMLRMETTGDVIKLLLVACLQLLTAPIAAHMVGRAAYRAGGDLHPALDIDQLAARRRSGRPPTGPDA